VNKREAKLRDDIVAYLTRPDVIFLKLNQTWNKPEGTGTTKSCPDLLCAVNGYNDLWELKRPRLRLPGGRIERAGELDSGQAVLYARLLRCSVEVQVVRSFEQAQKRIAFLRALPPSGAGLL
jgi:hypothetical protein